MLYFTWRIRDSNSSAKVIAKHLRVPVPIPLIFERFAPMSTIVPRPCDFCQVTYNAEQRYLNRGQGRYCSRSCSTKARNAIIEKEFNAVCAWCGTSIRVRPHILSANPNSMRFCSIDHKNRAAGDKDHPFKTGPNSNNQKVKVCPGCSENWNKRTNKYNVCPACRLQDKINQWLSGNLDITYIGKTREPATFVKSYLMRTRGDRCEVCGFCEKAPDGRSIIQMDHIDGNYLNNSIENLRLLCPNHHAMTETYGSRNRNKGRQHRRKSVLSMQDSNLQHPD